jgi:predicted 3-demethylubiquinone-9 3-methyltransferase (glyoxalase superfamily)
MPTISKITPCLWFDSNAEEAAKFYCSVLDGRIRRMARYGQEGKEVHGRDAGSVMTVEFELFGQTFTALNGGPHFKLNEAISFQVMCDTQEEIDRLWSKLGEGGDPQAQQCGWLKDRFGLSWQIVPTVMADLMTDADPAKTGRAMKAMLQMKKLDIATLKKAHAGQL